MKKHIKIIIPSEDSYNEVCDWLTENNSFGYRITLVFPEVEKTEEFITLDEFKNRLKNEKTQKET